MTGVRRPLAVLGLALAAGLVASGCSSSSGEPPPAIAAPPQEATLNWVERSPETGPALVFRTPDVRGDRRRLAGGARDREHDARGLGARRGPRGGRAVVRDHALRHGRARRGRAARRGRRPPGPAAGRTFDPPLPAKLRPGASWRGTVGATGALAAGRYVRVVFGPLVADDDPPEGMPGQFYWITDHAYRLRD